MSPLELLLLPGLAVTLLLAVVALARASQVDELRRRVAELEARLGRLTSLPQETPARPKAAAPPDPEPSPQPEPQAEAKPAPPQTSPAAEPPARSAPAVAATLAASRTADTLPDSLPDQGPKLDWERWLGVRGAALLGGVALALAGILFVHHAIQAGWLGPKARVSLAAAVGLACMAALGPIRARGFEVLGEALGGAGAVLLHGAAWAGYRLYGFLPMPLAFAAMGASTLLALGLSLRHRSRTVLVFAAVGGFATPLLLDTWRQSPIGLFGYLFGLDLVLLLAARRQGWRWVELLASVGTFGLVILWSVVEVSAGSASLGLGFLFLFAFVFAGTGARASQLTALAASLGLALSYAGRASLAVELWQLGLGLVPLAALVAWADRGREDALPTLAAAAGTVAVALAWFAERELGTGSLTQYLLVLLAAGAALVPLARWLDSPEGQPQERVGSGVLVLAAALPVGPFLLALREGGRLEPALTALAAVGSLGLGLAVATDRLLRPALPVLATLAGIGLVRTAGVRPAALIAAALGLALLAEGWRRRATRPELCQALGRSAVALLVPVLLALPLPHFEARVPHNLLEPTALQLLLAMVGTAGSLLASSGRMHALLLAAVLVGVWRWDVFLAWGGWSDLPTLEGRLQPALALRLGLALTLAGGVALARRGWAAAALAPVLLWLPVASPFRERWGPGGAALLVLGLGVCALAAFGLARWRAAERPAQAPYLAAGAGLIAAALCRYLDWQWGATVPALGALVAALAARALGSAGLFRGLALASLPGILALLAVALASDRIHGSGLLLSPSLAFVFLLPALTLGACLWSGRKDLGPKLTVTLGLGAALLGFAWVNLTVLDAFDGGRYLKRFQFDHQTRSLTQSLAWVLYAMGLLGFGLGPGGVGLRRLGLLFLAVALAKVSLWDLRELEGLYRVGSLVGLALALLLVSLLYQWIGRERPALSSG